MPWVRPEKKSATTADPRVSLDAPISAARRSHPFDDSSSAARSFTIKAMN
jgi:hypothetical protein